MKKVRILGLPSGLGAGHSRGSEHDWEVRTDSFVTVLRLAGFETEDCGCLPVPYPTAIGSAHAKYLSEIVGMCAKAADWSYETLSRNAVPLLVGGDHSIAAGSIAGVADHYR